MPESNQYDRIGELYEQYKDLPVGVAERATVLSVLPELHGRSVLDIGCGTGGYSRLFRRLGARHVVGVDPAREMLAYAQRVEEHEPLGISYEVQDGTAMPKLGEFDVVAAIWPLSHVGDRGAYDRMVANAATNLLPGGHFLAVVPTPETDWDGLSGAADVSGYGLSILTAEPAGDCVACTVRVDGSRPFEFVGYNWPPGVFEESCAAAGLTGVRRHAPVVPEAELAARGTDFWAPFVANPMFAVFTARRPV